MGGCIFTDVELQHKESSHKCINTLPVGISIEELTDCTVPAKFTTDDFNWMGGNLTMTVYRWVL